MRELFRQNLIIESDLQEFAAHLMEVATSFGVSRIGALGPLRAIIARARTLGAGRGEPVVAALVLDDQALLVFWGGPTDQQPFLTLRRRPEPSRVAALCERLRAATRVLEPTRLMARNREMNRQFEQTRKRLHEEIQAMQSALEQRQEQLHQFMKLAETDPLTGLLNRRAFDHHFERAFNRALRQRNEPLSLILLDLDEFKELNDQYGHQQGDEYLKRMAGTMRDCTRHDVDLCFRIGGDEFAILLFAGSKMARRKASQILEQMERRVSIGIASIESDRLIRLGRQHFFEAADEALYASKRNGRGRITLAGEAEKPAATTPLPRTGVTTTRTETLS